MTQHPRSFPSLRDKVVIVTGAGRGQGAAEAAALAEAGARVIACDIRWPVEITAGTTTDVTTADGIERRVLDVTDPDAWGELGQWVDSQYGVVHGLVNNAGMPFRARLEEVRLDDWNRLLAINVTGPLLGIQTVVPRMTDGGAIVNIGSLAAVTAHPAVAYTASKWALRGLSRVASLQLGDRRIRSNLVNPGFIETAMTDVTPETFRSANIQNASIGRVGTVDDVVGVVLFLLSDESSFITGAEIAVDGGQSGHGGAKSIFDAERNALAG